MAHHPSLSASSIQLAHAHRRAGRMAEAEVVCREILRREPGDGTALHLLGMLCHQAGRDDEAVGLLRQSVERMPGRGEFLSNLAAVLGRMGRHAEALPYVRQAVLLRPDHAEAQCNLGAALEATGAIDEAAACYGRAIALRPEFAVAHASLGRVLLRRGKADEAAHAFERSLGIDQQCVESWIGLAGAMEVTGQTRRMIKCYQRAATLRPDDAALHSRLVFAMHHHGEYDARTIYEAHLGWAKRFAEPLTVNALPHDNDRTPGRKLRVGYVSADFREHTVARFLEPFVECHDREQFEVYCYSDVAVEDAVTLRFKKCSHVWRGTRSLSDEQLAALIRADRLDILADPTGHMAGNRMRTFARRPAPVQVAVGMYAGSCGLSAMDYCITDRCQDPPGMTEHLYTERLVRLESGAHCYRPDDPSPEIGPLPSDVNGRVTFGAFNRLVKVTPAALDLWAQILNSVPGSRLLALVDSPCEENTAESVRDLFAKHGLVSSRVEFAGRRSRSQYLALLACADLALDTVPFNGYTTTCDCLWMGVPVITLAGQSTVSRVGVSLLGRVGLSEWVAGTPQGYVELAITLARDLPRLRDLRLHLRERMRRSPLTDGRRITAELEQAYWTMWRRWCKFPTGTDRSS